jgi:hypothetical protein
MRQFCRVYNGERPHEALGMRRPSQLYRPSSRRYIEAPQLCYPSYWLTRTVSAGGSTKWAGRVRHIGRAFCHQRIGLKAIGSRSVVETTRIVQVYLGTQLLGELHLDDLAGMRPAQWQHHKAGKRA